MMEYSEEDRFTKNKERLVKFFAVIFAIFVVLVVVYVVADVIYKIGKREITIKCAPYSAEVFIDGVRVKNDSKKWLEIGEHNVLCFLPGFAAEEEMVEITDMSLSYLKELLPITAGGEIVHSDSMKDYYDLESYAGSEKIESVLTENEQKLVDVLLYTSNKFGIGSTIEDGNLIATITTHKPGYIDLAVNKLLTLTQEAGLSIAEYRFRINDFVNQLEDRIENTETDLKKFIINSFTINVEVWNSGKIDGSDYYFALIAAMQPSTNEMVVYRAALIKDGDSFRFLSDPYPILTIYNTPDVPDWVLNEINKKELMWHGNS